MARKKRTSKKTAKKTKKKKTPKQHAKLKSSFKKSKNSKKKSKSKKKKTRVKQAHWGSFYFESDHYKINPISETSVSRSIEIDEESSKCTFNPYTQSLSVVLAAGLGVNIDKEIDKWLKAVNTFHYLMLGGRKAWKNPLKLKEVEASSIKVSASGTYIYAELSLTFETWDPKYRAKVAAEYKKKQKEKSAKKKKIKKGVWVKVTAKTYYDSKKKVSPAVRKRKWKVTKVSGNKVWLSGLKYPVSKSKCSIPSSSKSAGKLKNNKIGNRIANAGLSKRGCKYVWGTAGPNTFDCSGLCYWAMRHVGIKVSRKSAEGYHSNGSHVSFSNLSPGDICLFTNNGGVSGIHHAGIYIGGGRMVHAPHTGTVVQIQSISSGYYKKQFYEGRRIR